MGFFSTFRNGGRGRPRRSESGGLARRPIIRLYFQRHRREEGEECERFIDDERRRSQDYINKINKSEKKWQ